MKNLFNLLIVLSVAFIGAKFSYNEKHHQRTFYGTLNKVSNVLEKKYKIVAIGSGGQACGGPITLFSLSFNAYGPLTKEELRKLLINTSKDFLHIVNSDKEVQMYLANKPFTIANIHIIVFNCDKNGRESHDPSIAVAQLNDCNLNFHTVDPASPGYKNSYEESYEEALRLIQIPKSREDEKPI